MRTMSGNKRKSMGDDGGKAERMTAKAEADAALQLMDSTVIPTGTRYNLHERNKRLRVEFTDLHIHLPVEDFMNAFHSANYRFYNYDADNKTW